MSFQADEPTDLRLYGDPVNLKFPGDTKEKAANARVRFKQFAETYDEDASKAVVHERIVRRELAEGIEPGFDPDDPLDALLPQDLKDELEELNSSADKSLTPIKKAILRAQTGTTNDHWHTAEWDDETGRGSTTSPNNDPGGHGHEIVDGVLIEAEDSEGDMHTHSLDASSATIIEEFRKRSELIVIEKQEGDDFDPDKEVSFFGIVMKPEVPDSDGTVTSAKEIEQANDKFMKEFGTIGFMHSKSITDKVSILQNVIAPMDLAFHLPEDGEKKIRQGTWYQKLWTNDVDLVGKIRRGEITGLSIGGLAKKVPIASMVDGKIRLAIPPGFTELEKRLLRESVTKNEGDPAVDRFVGLTVEEVSLVDAAANEEVFFIMKNKKPGDVAMTDKDKKAAAKKAADDAKVEADKAAEVAKAAAEKATKLAADADPDAGGDGETVTKADLERVAQEAATKAAEAAVAKLTEDGLIAKTKEGDSDAGSGGSTTGDKVDVAKVAADAASAAVTEAMKPVVKKLDDIEGKVNDPARNEVVRVAAQGGGVPEEDANLPTDGKTKESKWAGTAIHNAVGRRS